MYVRHRIRSFLCVMLVLLVLVMNVERHNIHRLCVDVMLSTVDKSSLDWSAKFLVSRTGFWQ